MNRTALVALNRASRSARLALLLLVATSIAGAIRGSSVQAAVIARVSPLPGLGVAAPSSSFPFAPLSALSAVPYAEILSDHGALLVGESHKSLASVGELARAMPELAGAGVKVLGIEGLKRPHQEAVDAYVSGRARSVSDEALAFSPRRRAAFTELLKAARDSDVRVLAMGEPLDVWVMQAAALASERTGDPIETLGRTAAEQTYRAQVHHEPDYNESVAEVYLTRRNRSMADILAAATPPGGKAAALMGQNHIEAGDALPFKFVGTRERWGTVARELSGKIRAFSLTLTGGAFVEPAVKTGLGAEDPAAEDREVRANSYERAARLSPDGAPAYERTGGSTGLFHAGGVPR